MKNNLNGILSGAVSVGVFLVFLLGFRGGLAVSAGVGVVSYVICAFLIFRKKEVMLVADGVTQEDVREILAEGAQKLEEIKAAALKIPDQAVRAKMEGIVSIASSIYKDIQKDPRNIRQARKFISYYMETTGYIVKRYIEINANKNYLAGSDATMLRIDQVPVGVLGVLLHLGEGEHRVGPEAAADLPRQDGGASAVDALGRRGGLVGDNLRAAGRAGIALQRRLFRLGPFPRLLALPVQLAGLRGLAQRLVHLAHDVRLELVSAGVTVQLAFAAVEAKGRAATRAWGAIHIIGHTITLSLTLCRSVKFFTPRIPRPRPPPAFRSSAAQHWRS